MSRYIVDKREAEHWSFFALFIWAFPVKERNGATRLVAALRLHRHSLIGAAGATAELAALLKEYRGSVPYEELLKHLFKLNAGFFQMEMASERDREFAYPNGIYRLHRDPEPARRVQHKKDWHPLLGGASRRRICARATNRSLPAF